LKNIYEKLNIVGGFGEDGSDQTLYMQFLSEADPDYYIWTNFYEDRGGRSHVDLYAQMGVK